jgi:hypothetical protein
VMDLCHKKMTYYVLFCENYMDCHCDLYVLNLNCYCFALCMCLVLEAPHLGRQPKQGLYKKPIYSSIDRGIYGHVAEAQGGGVPSIFIGYTFIFLGTKEYSDIYLSVLYSSVAFSVNCGIYPIFLGY